MEVDYACIALSFFAVLVGWWLLAVQGESDKLVCEECGAVTVPGPAGSGLAELGIWGVVVVLSGTVSLLYWFAAAFLASLFTLVRRVFRVCPECGGSRSVVMERLRRPLLRDRIGRRRSDMRSV